MVYERYFPNIGQHLPPHERQDLLANYYRRLTDPDPEVHMPAALAWSRYEESCSTLLVNAEGMSEPRPKELSLGLARIEAHLLYR